MKKFLCSILLLIIITSSINAQSCDKIAVVNMSKIFNQSSKRIIASKKIENEFKGRASELQFLENKLYEKIQDFKKNRATMRPSERNKIEKSILEEREIFTNKAQIFEQENHRRQIEERKKIINYIENIVKHISRKRKYELVIDSNSIVYALNAKDITIDVLNQVK
ncbi:OmpH family outer membrane protein [Sodalis-like secondary symbiont of Drepanosiphum platanoidis]|uniref:OmpH family outer membrane protein n=1 Tax=Sodalis-like secondary symbiont of Drepanosiphum platanoidis TaxID=2994493 RepID=UPI003463BEF6